MRVTDLSREQLIQVKQVYLDEREQRTGISWTELANADSIVSDEEVYHEYANVEFYEDDFSKSEEMETSDEREEI